MVNSLLAWRPWLVAGAAATLLLTNLGGGRLWDDDETKNARCGAEMHERGAWVVPTFNGELRSHKPVLLYWAMRASYAAFGVSEFSARLPSALAGIAVVVMAYHLARLLFDRSTGLVAALLLVSSLMFAVLARAATPDGVLMVGTTAALLAFVAGVSALRGGSFSGPARGATPLLGARLPLPHAVAMYVAIGLAVLAKGPIGMLLPLWAIALYGLFGEPLNEPPGEGADRAPWRRRLRWLAATVAPRRWLLGARAVRLPLGLLLIALVAGPWYVAVTLVTGGDWLAGFLGTHNLGRFAGAMEGHDGRPFYYAYYLVTFLVGFFPGSCFLPVAAAHASWRRATRDPHALSYAFALAVVAAWLSVFSVAATKLPNYVAPCYLGLAALTAAWLVAQVRRFESAAGAALLRTWLAAGLGSCAAAGLVITVALGIVSWAMMGGSPLVGLVGLAPVAGGVVGLAMLHTARPRGAVAAFVAASLAFTAVGVGVVGPAASPFSDGPLIADAVESLETARGSRLRVATLNYTTPSLVWELDRRVPAIDGDEAARLLAEEDAVVAMSRETFEQLSETLPEGVGPVAEEGRFMRRHKRVVLVGPQGLVAQNPAPTARR